MGAGYNSANALAFYHGLRSQGLSPHQASGFLGNFMEESTLNPRAFNKKEGAIGAAQWRFDRADNLRGHAKGLKRDVYDPYAQGSFAGWEMKNHHPRSWALLQKATTPEEAAHAVVTWEKPGGFNPKTFDPTGVPSYRDRLNHASALHRLVTGMPANAQNANISGSAVPMLAQSADTATPAPASAPADATAAATPTPPQTGKFLGPDAAIRPGGGLVGLMNSDGGLTGDSMKSFLGGAEMKAGMGGLGMLAQSLAPQAAPPPPPMPVAEENKPDMSLLALIGRKKRGLV